MDRALINHLILHLRSKGILFVDGLSDEELQEVEAKFGFVFPPDLRAFLQSMLPIDRGFVDWRYGIRSDKAEKEILLRMRGPLEGIIFDIQHNRFWRNEWGTKPDDLPSQIEVARAYIAGYPTLIPIYSHRFLPSRPSLAGNPVFSVHQTDVIYYGYDLADYFAKEFEIPLPYNFVRLQEPIREIEFWDQL